MSLEYFAYYLVKIVFDSIKRETFTLISTMENYLTATTVHGFSYVHERYSLCTRIFWLFNIIGGFAVASSFIYQSLMEWNNDPTITTLDSIAFPIQNVQFPTVTVCPHEQRQRLLPIWIIRNSSHF